MILSNILSLFEFCMGLMQFVYLALMLAFVCSLPCILRSIFNWG